MTHIIDRLDEIEQGRAAARRAHRPRARSRWPGTLWAASPPNSSSAPGSPTPTRTKRSTSSTRGSLQGVLIGATGRGGDTFNGFAAGPGAGVPHHEPHHDDHAALVIAGDKDDSQHWTTMGPDWHADPYHLAPGPKTLLTALSTVSTSSAGSRATTASRPRTRVPTGSPRSPNWPRPTCAPRSTPTPPPGGRRRTHSPLAPTPSAASNPRRTTTHTTPSTSGTPAT